MINPFKQQFKAGEPEVPGAGRPIPCGVFILQSHKSVAKPRQ